MSIIITDVETFPSWLRRCSIEGGHLFKCFHLSSLHVSKLKLLKNDSPFLFLWFYQYFTASCFSSIDPSTQRLPEATLVEKRLAGEVSSLEARKHVEQRFARVAAMLGQVTESLTRRCLPSFSWGWGWRYCVCFLQIVEGVLMFCFFVCNMMFALLIWMHSLKPCLEDGRFGCFGFS